MEKETIIKVEITTSHVCRLCLKREGEMENILTNNLNLIDKIFQCTSILIQEVETNLPRTLCPACLKQIHKMYDFRQSCITNQRFFSDPPKCLPFETVQDTGELYDILIKDEHSELKAVPEFDTKESIEKQLEETFGDDVDTIQSDDDPPTPVKVKRKKRKTVKSSTAKKQAKIVIDPDEKKHKKTQLPCETCGQMMSRSRLEVHKNLHNGINPYHCDVENCGKSFYDKARLKGHKRDYHSGKIHECKICGKTYTVLNSLHSHQQLHLTPRYECKFCGRKYKKTSYLKVHMRTHTGEKPYKCPHCEKSFVKPDNLKTHIRSHTHEKPYKCTHCGQCFGYSYMLRKHIEKFHPNSQLNPESNVIGNYTKS